MTTSVVSDAKLGQISKRQWELFRRVKEGTLDADEVMVALQRIIQKETVHLKCEVPNWTVSSMVHEVMVTEDANFVSAVKDWGFLWDYGNRERTPFILEGNTKLSKGRPVRLHLAELPRVGQTASIGVIKIYADQAGYDLATPWDLLAFVRQSAATRVTKDGMNIAAYGDVGCRRFKRLDGTVEEETYSYVSASAYPKGSNWSFDCCGMAKSPQELDMREEAHSYNLILLREREKGKRKEK